MRLLDPTSGSIRFRGTDITSSGRRQLEPIRKEMQMVFQDPQASLNPRKRVGQILAVPLRLRGVAKDKIESESRELLAKGRAAARSASTASRTSSPAVSAS